MSQQLGIPLSAWNSLTQLVDHCAQIKPGQEVVILAHEDGVYGSDNWCDPQAVSWVKTAFASRGARVTVLWADEQAKEHAWRFPPVVKGAIAAADVFVNLSNDLVVEEVAEFRNFLPVCKTWYIRLFPVTANLLMTKWAQTPHELVCMVRHLSSNPFMKHLSKFKMTDPNGTELEGLTLDPVQRPGIPGMPYNSWRRDASPYIPYPEWVHPPINCKDVNGVFFFDAMLPWWSHYIGIKSSWETPIRIDVKETDNGYVVHAESPGVRKDEINVAIEGDQVTIAAEVKRDTEHKDGERVLRTERYYGNMYRSFTLPAELDENASEAKYDNGVLELKLVKKPAVAGRKLTIQ